MYDIFFVSRDKTDEYQYSKVKSLLPTTQKIENVKTFDEIKNKAFTKMFWVIWSDIDLCYDFNLLEYRPTKWDDQYIHVFKNGEHYDGLCLFPKSISVSQKEFDHRFFINKKEIDIVASFPRPYDKFYIDSYEEYLNALEQSKSEMFWMISRNLKADENFHFDIYFSHHNTYDRNQTHAYIHRTADKDGYNGIFLCSKKLKLSKREIEFRFPIERKEWPIVASGPVAYDKFYVRTYDDYENALKKSNTELFWMIFDDIVIDEDFKFDIYFRHDNQFDRKINHLFLNGEYYDGLILASKHQIIHRKEFDHRFLLEKKEWQVKASEPKPYDIVFLSYQDPDAEIKFLKFKNRFPRAIHIKDIKGIHQAHKVSAEATTTPMFWVVDSDAEVLEDFEFTSEHIPFQNKKAREILESTVHVYRSRNPLNGLEYGYGGVKLLPRKLMLNVDVNSVDMTTSISDKFRVMDQVSNITKFNTDPFSTWKSAFRECVKLSSKLIERQNDLETENRLNVWCTYAQGDYAEYCIKGANEGRRFGEENREDKTMLAKINNFDWLKEKFNEAK